MRSTLQVLAAMMLAVTFSAPVAAATPGGATEETLTGILEAVHVDEFETGREREDYLLRSSRGVIPLAFDDGGPDGYGGATVTVTGTRAGKALRVDSSRPGHSFRVTRLPTAGDTATVEAMDAAAGTSTATVTTASLEAATAAAPVAKSIAVILINFANLTTQPYTTSAVQNALTGSSTGVKAFFEEESKGRMTVAGAVFGWYTISAATTGCDWQAWHTLGWNAAAAGGVDLNAYTNVVFIWPYTSQCAWAGLGYVPGKYTYLNGTTSVQVMTHELGHNLGLGHANARNCTVDGTRVTIAAAGNCTTQTYADPFSTMGNNALRHNHGSQLGELGWLEASEKVVGEPGNPYTITPYFGASGVKLVRIPRGDGSFFDLDVRTPYGSFDNYAAGSPAVTGVTIRVGLGTASPTNTPKATELLDTTPSTANLDDAPLLVGRTMADPVSGISFTTTSISSAGVVIWVREAVAPSAPGSLTATATGTPSVELAWTAATDNVAVGSYRITRDGAQVATPAASATSWTDTGARLSATYTYAVTAVDTSGNAGPAVSASASMPAAGVTSTPAPSSDPSAPPDPAATPAPGPDEQPPTVPDPLTGTPTATTVSLEWGPASDDVAVTAYQITRDGAAIATATGTNWRDTGRTPQTGYTYTVTAVDGVGRVSDPASLTVTTTADTTRPTAPARFRRVARSGRYVTFAWRRSTDDVRVVRYYIYRYGSSRPVASTGNTRIRIATVYRARYYVRAVDAAGNGSFKSAVVRGR